uniref:Mitochondrial ribosomal protein S36 n=1 Tax=Acrobeloides nanus TaxID=290746 RepID=A0A914BXF0_9BILA
MSISERLFPAFRTFLTSRQESSSLLVRFLRIFFKVNPKLHDLKASTQSSIINNPIPSGNMQFTSIANFSQVARAHKPMIKFLGARLPRPQFDSNKQPPLNKSSSSQQNTSPAARAIGSSIGKVGTTPRGSGIDESQLPLRFRRHFIDQAEIDAINSGGATVYNS